MAAPDSVADTLLGFFMGYVIRGSRWTMFRPVANLPAFTRWSALQRDEAT